MERIGLEKMYSVRQAADLLSLSHWTIRLWIGNGKLRSAKVGRRRVIRESELRRLISDEPRRPETSAHKMAKKAAEVHA